MGRKNHSARASTFQKKKEKKKKIVGERGLNTQIKSQEA